MSLTPPWEILEGDCREVLANLPERSVHTCVTSPPYFGLRDYGTGEWEGGDPTCEHRKQDAVRDGSSTLGWPADGGPNRIGDANVTVVHKTVFHDRCGICGATRVDRQIGLEPTPDEFVAALVEVFREVRRVLRDDGTVWLNLGDSYSGSGPSGASYESATTKRRAEGDGQDGAFRVSKSLGERGLTYAEKKPIPAPGTKAKDLIGIPWMVAFALRADGWVLRSEIVWNKPNPMPESVTDRPTKAHEQIFLFSKARWTGAEEPLPMRAVDAAWLAALIDGEGSICFQDRTSEGVGQKTYSVRLSIVNTNRALLERVEQICGLAGVGSPSPRTRSSGASGRPVYAWQVTNAKAARVIAAIRPYLVAKTTQADLALYVQALNRKHTGRGGYSVSRADQEGKAKAAAACSALNRGQDVDLAWFRPVKPGQWVPLPYTYDADAIREDDSGRPSGNGFVRDHGLTYQNADGTGRGNEDQWEPGGGRNKRSVWTVATQPYAGAHFATFPPKLIEPCVLAGAPERCCASCGAPWARITERFDTGQSQKMADGWDTGPGGHGSFHRDGRESGKAGIPVMATRTVGFEPSCACEADRVPGIVLDPFAGAGTTGLVAVRNGRSFVGVELNPEYAQMARDRIETDIRLGHRSPQRGPGPLDGQGSLLDALDDAA